MKSQLKLAISLFIVTAAALLVPAGAQTSPVVDKPSAQPDLALTYSYIRSNAPPAQCGCFSLNGGSVAFAWPIKSNGFAVMGDITAATTSNGSASGAGLTLSTYAGGVRYKPHVGRSALQPFGQVLVGVAHTSGALVQSQNSATTNANAAFAAEIGGGLDLHLNRRLLLRLFEADYLPTTFNNSINNHQNNLRLSTGMAFYFGKQ
jgi:peptidoglycan-associated lipoprotein